MKDKGKAKRWPKILIGILFLAVVLILLFRFAELQQIVSLLKTAKISWIVIALAIQFIMFALLALAYKVILGAKSFWNLFKTTIAMVFVDQAIPSFSVSGNALLYYSARKEKIKKARASLLIGLNIFLNFLVYFVLFLAGLFYILASKGLVAYDLWTIVLIIAAFTLVYRILWTATGERHFKKIISVVLRRWAGARQKTLNWLDDFYKSKKELKKKTFILATILIFFTYLFKVLVIAAIFFALGYVINPGVLIVGYALTSFLSSVSYVRIGVYEAVMTLAYSQFGIAYNLALTATMIYRLISFWVLFIIGFFCFSSIIRNKKK